MAPVAENLARLAAALDEAPAAELPAIVGALEQLKARAWARLVTPPECGSSAERDRLLSLPEVAKVLGVPDDRAYDLAREGKLAVVAIGKYRRVRESALRAYLEASELPAVSGRVPRRRAG